MSGKPKRPPMGKIKSWSVGLGAKLTGNSSLDTDLLGQTAESEHSHSEMDRLDFREAVAAGEKAAIANDKDMPDASAHEAGLTLVAQINAELSALQNGLVNDTAYLFDTRIMLSRDVLDAYSESLQVLDTCARQLATPKAHAQNGRKDHSDTMTDMRTARAEYESALADAKAHANALNEAKLAEASCLAAYMQLQVKYVAQAKALLDQVSSVWGAPAAVSESRFQKLTPRSRPRALTGSKTLLPALSRRNTNKDDAVPSADTSNSVTEDESNGKKSRLRMPSFTAASDTVSSMANGIGTFSRSKSSMFSMPGTVPDTGSPERERTESGKWSFLPRSKKDQGFTTMDDHDRQPFALDVEQAESAYDIARKNTRRSGMKQSVSSNDVGLFPHDDRHSASLPQSPSMQYDQDFAPFDSDFGHRVDGQTRSSPDHAHTTIRERGDSSFSREASLSDGRYLSAGLGALDLNHTGQSAFSDTANPFMSSALSPQSTGQQPYSTDDDSDNDRYQQSSTAAPTTPIRRGPPPPVPSSADYLSKSRAKPTPPPLPSRNSHA